jgi:hypothetical protein
MECRRRPRLVAPSIVVTTFQISVIFASMNLHPSIQLSAFRAIGKASRSPVIER